MTAVCRLIGLQSYRSPAHPRAATLLIRRIDNDRRPSRLSAPKMSVILPVWWSALSSIRPFGSLLATIFSPGTRPKCSSMSPLSKTWPSAAIVIFVIRSLATPSRKDRARMPEARGRHEGSLLPPRADLPGDGHDGCRQKAADDGGQRRDQRQCGGGGPADGREGFGEGRDARGGLTAAELAALGLHAEPELDGGGRHRRDDHAERGDRGLHGRGKGKR